MNKMLEAALETARDLHGSGVMKKTTLRQIEELCLPPRRKFNSDDTERIRTAAARLLPILSTKGLEALV